jgi:hypothetical protein
VAHLTDGQQRIFDAAKKEWDERREFGFSPLPRFLTSSSETQGQCQAPLVQPVGFWLQRALDVPAYAGYLAFHFPDRCGYLAPAVSPAAAAWQRVLDARKLRGTKRKSAEVEVKEVKTCNRCKAPIKNHSRKYCDLDGGPRPCEALVCPYIIPYPMPAGVFSKGALQGQVLQSKYEEIEQKRRSHHHAEGALDEKERHLLKFAIALGALYHADTGRRVLQTGVYDKWFEDYRLPKKEREALDDSLTRRSASPSPARSRSASVGS